MNIVFDITPSISVFSYAWSILLVTSVFVAAAIVLKRSRDSFLKLNFLLSSICLSLWIICSFFSSSFGSPRLNSSLLSSTSLGWLSYFSLSLLLVFFGNLLFAICHPKEIAKLRYWIFQGNNIIASLLSFSYKEGQLNLSSFSGMVETYIVFSLLLFFAYTAFILFSAYRKSEDEYSRFKIRSIYRYSTTSLFMAALIILSIPIIPATAQAAAVFELVGVSTAFGISRLLTNGPRLYLEYSIRGLLASPEMQSQDEVLRVCGVIDGVRKCLEGAGSGENQLSLLSVGSERNQVQNGILTIGTNGEPNSGNNFFDEEYFINILEGIEKNNLYLSEENQRLSYMKESMHELKFPHVTNSREAISSSALKGVVAEVQNNNFRNSVIVASKEYEAIVSKALRFVDSKSPIIIEGESGSGRSTLAKLIHAERDTNELRELNCYTQNDRNFLKKLSTDSVNEIDCPGLIVKNIEILSAQELSGLLPLLNQDLKNSYLYLTAKEGFLAESLAIDYYSYYPLRQHHLKISPLRERREDLLGQFFLYVDRISRELNISLKEISPEVLEQLQSHSWPRNSRELKMVIRKSLADLRPKLKKGFILENLLIDEKTDLNLTSNHFPEFNHNRVALIHSIRVNHFQLDQVAQDLDIAREELNLLLDKFSLELPSSHSRKIVNPVSV